MSSGYTVIFALIYGGMRENGDLEAVRFQSASRLQLLGVYRRELEEKAIWRLRGLGVAHHHLGEEHKEMLGGVS